MMKNRNKYYTKRVINHMWVRKSVLATKPISTVCNKYRYAQYGTTGFIFSLVVLKCKGYAVLQKI